MGTRADFYVGRGPEAEWLGSIAWDGYPAGIDEPLLLAKNEQQYRERVTAFIEDRDDGTKPEMGWPWPWNDSRTTDYAYTYDGGKVWSSCFGYEWFDPTQPEPEDEDADQPPEKVAVFPDMTERKNVVLGGKRSGLTVVERRRDA
jgi:hypothetical protein